MTTSFDDIVTAMCWQYGQHHSQSHTTTTKKEDTMHTTTITTKDSDWRLSEFGVGDLITFTQPLNVYRIEALSNNHRGLVKADLVCVASTRPSAIDVKYPKFHLNDIAKVVHCSGSLRYQVPVPAVKVDVRHKYAIGDTIHNNAYKEKFDRVIEGVYIDDYGAPRYLMDCDIEGRLGNSVEFVDHSHTVGGEPFFSLVDPTPPIVSETVITITQRSPDGESCYGSTARRAQKAVASSLGALLVGAETFEVAVEGWAKGYGDHSSVTNPKTVIVDKRGES